MPLVVILFTIFLLRCNDVSSFPLSPLSPLSSVTHVKELEHAPFNKHGNPRYPLDGGRIIFLHDNALHPRVTSSTILHALSEDEEQELKEAQEEARLKILSDRRKTIRWMLKAAEVTKNFRLKNGMYALGIFTTGLLSTQWSEVSTILLGAPCSSSSCPPFAPDLSVKQGQKGTRKTCQLFSSQEICFGLIYSLVFLTLFENAVSHAKDTSPNSTKMASLSNPTPEAPSP